jgi:hypothetical protein
MATANSLAERYEQPPESAKPWVYWFWMNGNISKEGITADLEALAENGFGGVFGGELPDTGRSTFATWQ